MNLSILTDLIPAEYRKTVYDVAALLAVVYTVWQGAEGDWRTFVGSLLATFVPLLAAANTATSDSDTEVDEATGLGGADRPGFEY